MRASVKRTPSFNKAARGTCTLRPPKFSLTPPDSSAYSSIVAETEVTRASRLDQIQADNRQPAVFFCPYAFARLLQWRALAEGTPSGVPASCIAGPRTLKPCACHPRFAALLAGLETADTGGRTMLRHIPARPEQTPPRNQHPLFERAGIQAAQLWLQGAPLSMGEWRDLRWRNLVAGAAVLPGDEQRHDAFNQAFADQIGRFIALRSHAGVQS